MVRFRRKYLSVQTAITGQHSTAVHKGVSHRLMLAALKDSLVVNFGDFGLASATPGLFIKDLDAANDSEASPCGLFVIRCNSEAHQVLRAALTLITGYDKVRYVCELPMSSSKPNAAAIVATQYNRRFVKQPVVVNCKLSRLCLQQSVAAHSV
eukprot:4742-Heterococcus_DN1.PRE.3